MNVEDLEADLFEQNVLMRRQEIWTESRTKVLLHRSRYVEMKMKRWLLSEGYSSASDLQSFQ